MKPAGPWLLRLLGLGVYCAALACSGQMAGRQTPGGDTALPRLEFLGMAILPAGLTLEGVPVGGLSGLAWDAADGSWWAISDDPGTHGPPRRIRFEISLTNGRLERDGVRPRDQQFLREADGSPAGPGILDAEDLALLPGGNFYLSSEGQVRQGIPPALRLYRRDGRLLEDLPLPAALLDDGTGAHGIRPNTGPEGLALSPDGEALYVLVENALLQDRNLRLGDNRSAARLLRWDRRDSRWSGAGVVPVDPLPARPDPPEGFADIGYTALLALGEDDLLALQRSYVEGHGNFVQLLHLNLRGAGDVHGFDRLDEVSPSGRRPASRRQLLDLAALEIPIDNLEGLALGPVLPGGARLLVLMSDDNFDPEGQITQFLAFALGPAPGSVRRPASDPR